MNQQILQAQLNDIFQSSEMLSKHQVRGKVGMLIKSITEQYEADGDVFFSVHGPQIEGEAEWLHGSMYENGEGSYSITLDRGISKYVNNVLFITPLDTNTSIQCSWEASSPDYVDHLQIVLEKGLCKESAEKEMTFKSDFQRIYDYLKSILEHKNLYLSIQS